MYYLNIHFPPLEMNRLTLFVGNYVFIVSLWVKDYMEAINLLFSMIYYIANVKSFNVFRQGFTFTMVIAGKKF